MLPPSARPPHPCYGTETRQKAGCPRHPAFLHLSGEIFANLRADFSGSGGCSRICLRLEERVERAAQRTSATESSSATTARYPSSVKNALLYALARAARSPSCKCTAPRVAQLPLVKLRRIAAPLLAQGDHYGPNDGRNGHTDGSSQKSSHDVHSQASFFMQAKCIVCHS